MKFILATYTALILLTACNAQSKKKQSLKDNPVYQENLKAFNQQKHRLEIKECEIVYNGKSFFLKSSIDELQQILGKEYEKSIGNFSGKLLYNWKKIGLKIRLEKQQKNIELISFDSINASKKILFLDAFIDGNTLMQDFISNSNYTFNDLLIGNHSYELIMKKCKKATKVYISSKVPWIYKGSGHLQYKDKIDFTKTKKIESIDINYVNK